MNNINMNNNGRSGPVIITAECKIKHGLGDNWEHYNCLIGRLLSTPFLVTIHNYESEVLGYDPTIKSYQNYFRFLHLSTLLNFPWGGRVKFRDVDSKVVFGAGDIVRLLEEKTPEVMKKWELDNERWKIEQDETARRVYGKEVKEEEEGSDSSNGDVDDNNIITL